MNDRQNIEIRTPPCTDVAKTPARSKPLKKRAPPAAFTVSLNLDKVRTERIAGLPSPTGAATTRTLYASAFTVVVDGNGTPFQGAAVTLTDVANPGNQLRGTTGADGSFSGSLPGAVNSITFRIDDNIGGLLASGTGTLTYAISGKRAVATGDVTLTAGATLATTATPAPATPARTVTFTPSPNTSAPFEGVDAAIVGSAPGMTDANGMYTATPSTAARTGAGISWTDSSNSPQNRRTIVP